MPTLLEKIHGCNAAVNISNSMGDVTEGKSYQEIEERFAGKSIAGIIQKPYQSASLLARLDQLLNP